MPEGCQAFGGSRLQHCSRYCAVPAAARGATLLQLSSHRLHLWFTQATFKAQACACLVAANGRLLHTPLQLVDGLPCLRQQASQQQGCWRVVPVEPMLFAVVGSVCSASQPRAAHVRPAGASDLDVFVLGGCGAAHVLLLLENLGLEALVALPQVGHTALLVPNLHRTTLSTHARVA